MRVLVVEDDNAIAEPLVEGLTREGYDVTHVDTGTDALSHIAEAELVLLDLNLPDLEGFEVCRQIREQSAVPIICLTARAEEVDRVRGLELGADDYVVKPFGFQELVARMRAVTRRGAPTRGPIIRVGPLRIDQRSRVVTLGDDPVDLTPKEFGILVALAADRGAVVERQDLLERVWRQQWYGSSKTLDVHIASLRRKLGDVRWIEAVRGVGFRLDEPE